MALKASKQEKYLYDRLQDEEDMVERLKDENKQLEDRVKKRMSEVVCCISEMSSEIVEFAKEKEKSCKYIVTKWAEIRKLRAALKPFADAAKRYTPVGNIPPDKQGIWAHNDGLTLTAQHLLDAKKAMALEACYVEM